MILMRHDVSKIVHAIVPTIDPKVFPKNALNITQNFTQNCPKTFPTTVPKNCSKNCPEIVSKSSKQGSTFSGLLRRHELYLFPDYIKGELEKSRKCQLAKHVLCSLFPFFSFL